MLGIRNKYKRRTHESKSKTRPHKTGHFARMSPRRHSTLHQARYVRGDTLKVLLRRKSSQRRLGKQNSVFKHNVERTRDFHASAQMDANTCFAVLNQREQLRRDVCGDRFISSRGAKFHIHDAWPAPEHTGSWRMQKTGNVFSRRARSAVRLRAARHSRLWRQHQKTSLILGPDSVSFC